MSYTIQAGDTLSKIAAEHNCTVNDLMRLNPDIKDPNKIKVGQVLVFETETPEDVVANNMSAEERRQILEQQAKELENLKNRTLGQQAKEEFEQHISEVKQELVDTYHLTQDKAEEIINESIETLIAAYLLGKVAFETCVDKVVSKATEYYEKGVDKANEIKENIAEVKDEIKKELIEKYNMTAEAVDKFLDESWDAIVSQYESGVDAYHRTKEALIAEAVETYEKVKEGYNNTVDKAEEATKTVAHKAKETAKKAHESMRADVTPKETANAVDLSSMTEEELIAYQNELIETMKNEKLSERAVRELQEKLTEVKNHLKEKYNKAVDGVFGRLGRIGNGLVKVGKKFFGWLRGE